MINAGKSLESDFQASCKFAGLFIKRINDPAQSFGSAVGLRFSPHNGYDFEVFKKPNLFCLEMKSTKNTSISFERECDDKKSSQMIKYSQIKALVDASQYDGIISGFILNWRETNLTYFVNINDFIDFYNSTAKKSINQCDIRSMPHILISQKLLKVHYRYDIDRFISDCVAQY